MKARLSKLKMFGGRLVSARSKTGDPQCSAAMSAKVNARLGNPVSMALNVANAILGKCRSMARMAKGGRMQTAAGNPDRAAALAKAQAATSLATKRRADQGKPISTRDRKAALPGAKGLLAEARAKRAAKAKPTATTSHKPVDINQRPAARQPGDVYGKKGEAIPQRPADNPFQPKADAPFSLLQRSAKGSKGPENTGRGITKTMFDMKRGDLKGQTSIFDRVGTVDTKTGATSPASPSAAQLARHLPKVSGGSPEAILARAQAAIGQRSRTAARLGNLKAIKDEYAAPETFGKPGKAYEMKTDAVNFDPERFQYKLGAQGSHGVTDQLKGVGKWDPELAGAVSVWKDPSSGKTFVVNGHHRLDLAKKLGVEKVTVKYLDAKTPEQARAKGALVNIAEGRGTSVDAAKFFRDSGINHEAIKAKGISLKERTASEGLALAGLEERAFKRVINGEMTTARAAIIGGSGLTHEQQAAVVKLLDKPSNRKLSDGAVRNLTDSAKAAGSRTREVKDLFGSSQEEESLAIHRATLEDKVKRSLSADKRLFGLVSKSKAAQSLAERGRSQIDTGATGEVSKEAADTLHVFDQLKHRDHRLSKILNEGSERLANGDPAKAVESETRRKATSFLKDLLSGKVGAFD
jgi:hypothetical protein